MYIKAKDFFGLRNSFYEECEYPPEPESSLVFDDLVESSKPLKVFAENDNSPTQEISPMPESLTSRSNQDFYAEFLTLSGCHVKTFERYGCPMDNFENVSPVEGFSCGEVLNSCEQIIMSEWRDDWLAAMTKEVNSLLENKV